uniref:NADH-ubiquinone oxidoreductase chain 3 n=1 Tax=Cladotaenia vulturi TaxID=1917734 RepID=A0A1J0I302_9CEST|nr:NADH dehydrogenase subunit 3 [Cladotaenia vulturi]APC62898.1 NADH dehydrogenase subunit 3 [Cladotaenia vulturi]
MVVLLYICLIFIMLFLVVYLFNSGILNKCDIPVVYWASSYECGFNSNSVSLNCFSFTYFSLMVLFVIFDLEISLLLNMPEQGLMFDNFIYYNLFLIILTVGFLIELFVGYIRWNY